MITFLQENARDADFNTSTIMAMASGVRSVIDTLGIPLDTSVRTLDVEELMDNFQQRRGPAFRSAATYRTRLRAATQLYLAWLDDDPDWKSIARARRSAPAPTLDVVRSPATQTVEFPIDRGFKVRIELPLSLNKHTAGRLHALIDSLVVDDDVAAQR
ncbi:hypothetical protein AB0J74_09110 [Asanoa sp. NPDC049573]|uniref:hypothetical protein n=1 Tax=Asanoa sp. NPDC049573 TaxID=3155396 RepID=UPI0034175959